MLELITLLLTLTSLVIVSCGDLLSSECLDCLCQLVSQCDINRGCDGGGGCGPFGISMLFWEDIADIEDPDGSMEKDPIVKAEYEKCAADFLCSTKAMQKYAELYKKDCNKDGVFDCMDYAAIHIQGPLGCLKEPFPEEKKSFMEKCLKEKTPGVYSVKIHELIEQEKQNRSKEIH